MNTTLTTPQTSPCSNPPAFGASAELITPEQLAQRLGISRRSLSNWTRNRLVPMIKIGRVCRFDFAQVRAALERYEQKVAAWREEGIDPSKYYDGVSVYGALQSLLNTSTSPESTRGIKR